MRHSFLIIFSFLAVHLTAQKHTYIPIHQNGDTSLWYKWQSTKYRKAGLQDMLFTTDSLRFRFSTEVEAVEIWTNDYVHFDGIYSVFTTSPDENSNGDQEKEKFFSGYWALTADDARKAYDLYKSLNINSINPQDSIQGWQSGFDGDEFIIEHATPTYYSFKPYWTPNNFKDKIPDAFLIDSFASSIRKTIRFSERFHNFISTLPKGCYRVGSYFVTCNNLKPKRKLKSGG